MEVSFMLQSKQEMVDEQEEDPGSSFFDDDEEAAESSNSISSSSSDFIEDATSCPSNGNLEEGGPLFGMSNLIAQLPYKRGLSKHFHGKSQSFSSLTNVRSLEDLAKPEKPYKKKLKGSKSYGGGLDCHKALACCRVITKKPLRGSFSSLERKGESFVDSSRRPIPPRRNLISTQALLFT